DGYSLRISTMRRHGFLLGLAVALVALVRGVAGGDTKETRSALATDPKGWTDLLADGLKHWKRVPIPPGSKLSARDPWSLDPATKTLRCDGVGLHEMLLYDREFADGILHVEWRVKKIDDKKGYNSGVYVRNSAD